MKLFGLKLNNEGTSLAITSVSCETDFVANTDYFKDYSNVLLDTLLERGKTLDESDYSKVETQSGKHTQFQGTTVHEALKVVIAKTQENCNIVSNQVISISQKEVVGTYLHSSPGDNLGVKASYVILSVHEPPTMELKNNLVQFANNLAMHIVAANTKFLKKSDVPAEVLEKETEILEEQSKKLAEGKDHSKILKGKIAKWYEETCLFEQTYLILDHDDLAKPKKVGEVLKSFSVEHKVPNLEIKDFKLFL